MKKFFNKKFVLRWGLRFLIFGLITFYQVPTGVHHVMVYVVPFIFGAIVCGWCCPAGLIQELVFIKKFKIKIPDWLHKKLRWMRYIFMITMFTGVFVVPGNIQHGIGNLMRLQFVGAYIPITFVIVSVFINRFFCRYFCPFGALAGIKSIIRPITICRDVSSCVNCKKCNKVCPMQIKVNEIKSLYSPNCVNCFRCIEKCPKKSLKIRIRDYRMSTE